MGKKTQGFLLAILAVFVNAGMTVFVKLAESASVATLVFARFVIGVPLFLWVIRKYQIQLEWKHVPKNLARSIAGICALYAAYYAIQTLPLVNAITLSNTAPLFLPILYLIWNKILISKIRFLAIGLGFLGVCVILRPSTSEFIVVGSFFGLVAGLCRAIALFNIRQLAKTEETKTILSYYFFTGAALSFFPVFFDWSPITDPLQWLYVLFAAIFALIFQYAMTKASADVPATKMSSINYLTVVLSGLFGWWIFGEIPDMWVLVGALIIIAGALIAIFDQSSPIRLKK